MTSLAWLIPIALGMGVVALLAFLWSMQSGQYDDLDGAAERVLLDPTDRPTDARKRDAERPDEAGSDNDIDSQER